MIVNVIIYRENIEKKSNLKFLFGRFVYVYKEENFIVFIPEEKKKKNNLEIRR